MLIVDSLADPLFGTRTAHNHMVVALDGPSAAVAERLNPVLPQVSTDEIQCVSLAFAWWPWWLARWLRLCSHGFPFHHLRLYAPTVAGRNAELWYYGFSGHVLRFPYERQLEFCRNQAAGVWPADDAIFPADRCQWAGNQPEVMPNREGEEECDEQPESMSVRRGSPGPTAAPLGRQETSPKRRPVRILAATGFRFTLLPWDRLSGASHIALGDDPCFQPSASVLAPSGVLQALPAGARASTPALLSVGACGAPTSPSSVVPPRFCMPRHAVARCVR